MKDFYNATVFEISGKNFPLLLSKINLKKIPFENLHYVDGKMRITIDKQNLPIFKKIVAQSWKYKILASKGVGSKISYAIKRIGFLIGAIAFIMGTVLCDNLVLKVDYKGDYKYFSYDIEQVLKDNGVKRFSLFSELDYKDISEQIYAVNPLICYSSVKKEGNSLVIEVKKSQSFSGGIKALTQLIAPDSGEIFELKVYRGVCLKKVGDKVEKGEVIVSGERIEEDKVYSDFVLASVSILKRYSYEEEAEQNPQNMQRALGRAKLLCGAQEYYKEEVTCENNKILVQLEYIIAFGG